MADTKELTYAQVAEHTTKKDLYVVIHSKVYDATSFVDEHPGGEEVLLDIGGQDATEAFEDVGHSDEAREILAGLLIADLKHSPGDPVPRVAVNNAQGPTSSATTSGSASGLGVGLYAFILIGGAVAFGAYKYLEAGKQTAA